MCECTAMSRHSEVRDCLMAFGPHLFRLTPTVKLDDKTHVRMLGVFSHRVIIYYLNTQCVVPLMRETHMLVFWIRDSLKFISALKKFGKQLQNLAQSLRLHSEVCYKVLNTLKTLFSSNKMLWLLCWLKFFLLLIVFLYFFLLIQFIINILHGKSPK